MRDQERTGFPAAPGRIPKTRPAQRRITLADVARASGFSSSTVSLVLNKAPLSRYIPPKTKNKITEAAEALGYMPNVFARSLRSQRSFTIGILVFDLADPFCTLILQGIERKLLPTPYLPILMDVQNQAQRLERYLEMMLSRRVEGLITVANWLFLDMSLLEDVDDRHIPTVVVGRSVDSPTVASVMVNNETGGCLAIEHLYDLGHREIAFIRGPRRLADSRARWKGIARFAKSAHLPLKSELIRDLPGTLDSNSNFEGGYRLAQSLIQEGETFTAISAFDDLTAYGAIRALTEAGRKVPDDCSVIGFDDIPAAAIGSPGLTTVRQPMGEMGEFAADYVLKHLGTEEEFLPAYGTGHLMAPSIVRRGSTSSRRRTGKKG